MKGKVYLVGAGPGDYKLMTLKGMECIKKSDVIVYDRLANEKYLKEAKDNCEFIYVGKASSNHALPQDQINKVITKKALEGKIVTRLKGGDPYVFGRGGEEAEFLLDNGIEFEVVPGITSAIGGLCYAGIPITHRDYSSSFHVITGHLKDDENDELNWNALANNEGTLVFLMGIANLKKISNNLIREGKSKETPVALISWATRYNQSVVTGSLENIYDIAIKEGVKPPTLIVVGDVVKLREKLNFFENKPLFGKNILVTRARTQSSTLVEKIMDLGGNPIEIPTIKIEKVENNKELENEINNIKKYNYLILTSQNGVNIFFDKLNEMNLDLRVLANLKICAIGPATSKELKKRGIIADIVPEKFVGEAMYDTLKDMLNNNDNILIPRGSNARDFLVDKLSEICNVKEVYTYNTIIEDKYKDEIIGLLNDETIDYITFTSSSTVSNFIDIIGRENIDKLKGTKVISIGPITSNTAKNLGLEVYKEPSNYTINDLINCIIQD
ncbi:bifunctional uroporphyrinogen-III methyltransferase/uroporphyrinogen-III synthase [[Clostridium] sordellii]|uniref:uroporphyrinogen-III C-methyltransferase n=1 Tax=Paraclostridium sordellii TaxID=1505 RepID=UPI0005E370DB|nr:uroporphyrinogen-III C-methyltransferase [Paeniclostridium sordellii]CEN89748.1 bifunctional uroporphyrinogen-III methyltransferase/uroporphyrinogen-III synthase [[Clostridium] sordellii] [Paeniclostridium sordellii]